MTFLTEAIILKKSHLGDFDRQYFLLTKELGKIKVLAKSANKINSKLAAHLEPFSLSLLMIAPGKSLFRLAAAKNIQANKAISSDFLKIILSSVFFEAIDLLLANQQRDQLVFALAKKYLQEISISSNTKDSIITLNRHLFELLLVTGYKPRLTCQSQRQLVALMIRTIEEATDKQVRSFDFLHRYYNYNLN